MSAIPVKDFIKAVAGTASKFDKEAGTLIQFRLNYTWLKAKSCGLKMLNASRIDDSIQIYVTNENGNTEVDEVNLYEVIDKQVVEAIEIGMDMPAGAMLEHLASLYLADMSNEIGAIVDVPTLMFMNSSVIPKEIVLEALRDIDEMVAFVNAVS